MMPLDIPLVHIDSRLSADTVVIYDKETYAATEIVTKGDVNYCQSYFTEMDDKGFDHDRICDLKGELEYIDEDLVISINEMTEYMLKRLDAINSQPKSPFAEDVSIGM